VPGLAYGCCVGDAVPEPRPRSPRWRTPNADRLQSGSDLRDLPTTRPEPNSPPSTQHAAGPAIVELGGLMRISPRRSLGPAHALAPAPALASGWRSWPLGGGPGLWVAVLASRWQSWPPGGSPGLRAAASTPTAASAPALTPALTRPQALVAPELSRSREAVAHR